MRAKVHVTLKNGVLDPQGQAIVKAVKNLGVEGISGVKQGKFFELDIAEKNKDKAAESVKAVCEKLLANTVIENYSFELAEK